MADATPSTTQIHRRLDRLRAGDESALDELLTIAFERLNRLARRMLRGYPGVSRWVQTDDVFQGAAVRLSRALREAKPDRVRSFINLAAVQIRRELIDLARHYDGPLGPGRHHASRCGCEDNGAVSGGSLGPVDPGTDTDDPARLVIWTEFHQQVEALPEAEREVFDLLYYQGLPQAEAATVLGVTERQVRYRWQSARVQLYQQLGGRLPD
jgi:RNA polymerase sigma-70 factor (ECF subfamily)